MINEAGTAVTRLSMFGIRSGAALDLLLVGCARRESDAVSPQMELTARNLLRKYDSIGRLRELSAADLKEYFGLEDFESLRCLALMELGRKIELASNKPVLQFDDPKTVAAQLSDLRGEKKEYFVALLLDSKNQLLKRTNIHVGTVNMSVVGPREVFREAIREGSASIIVAHNHPSGDPTPSPEDIEVTAKLVEVGRMLDIPVLDHVIVGDPGFVSMRAKGIIH